MIEKGLNQHNFIPGTERYTKPEEVKALNKFLKSIREVQEEHTEVSEDNLALPDSQPVLPEIENLPLGKLDVDSNENRNLDNTKLNLESGPDKTLDKTRLDISGETIETLEDAILGITPGQDKELEDTKLDIKSNQDKELEDTKLDIKSNQDKELDGTRLSITPGQDRELETGKLKISARNKATSLEKTKLKIKGESVKSLETGKEKINPGKDKELETGKQKIQANELDSLNTSRIEIISSSEKDLETKFSSLTPNNQVQSLSEKKETIDPEENQELVTGKHEIQENKIDSLNTSRINIESRGDQKLGTEKLVIQENITGSLETTKLEIEKTSITSLGSAKKTIKENQVNSLSTERTSLTSGTDLDLETKKETITKTTINSLDQSRISGPGRNEVGDLEKSKEEIPRKEVSGLEESKAEIKPAQISSLSDSSVELKKTSSINTLGTAKETILENIVDSLVDSTHGTLKSNEVSLEETSTKLKKGKDTELETTRKSGPEENSLGELENSSVSLSSSEDRELETERKKLNSGESLESLEDFIDTLGNTADQDLSDIQIALNFGQSGYSGKLEDTVIAGPGNSGLSGRTITTDDYSLSEVELKNTQIGLKNTKKTRKLETKVLGLTGEKETELNYTREDRPENSDITGRTITDPKYSIKENLELGDSVVVPDIKPDTDGLGLIDENRILPEKDNIKNVSLNLDKIDLTAKVSKEIKDLPDKSSKINNLPEGYTSDNRTVTNPNYELTSHTQLQDTRVELKEDQTKIDLQEKVKGLMNVLPEGEIAKEASQETKVPYTIQSVNNENTFKEEHNSFKDTPGYQLPSNLLSSFKNYWSGNALNSSTYLRWAAENTVGKIPLHGTWKKKLIDETLAFLVLVREKQEKFTKTNKDHLPGNTNAFLGMTSLKSLTKTALDTITGAFSKSVDKSEPINYPNGKQYSWLAPGQTFLDSSYSVSGKSARRFQDLADSDLKQLDNSGIYSLGVGTTLEDLVSEENNLSLESFKSSISRSRYLTSPNKFTSTANSTNYMTLDSNHVWEIILRPYMGALNGSRTWLPSFYEIDQQNKNAFGVSTHFARGWLPITGFDFKEKRLTSKDLQLYNGSFSYPIGMEFTNELQIVFADDSLKSLRRYFDLCAKVSAYMSNIHTSTEKQYDPGQSEKTSILKNPTVYLEGKIHPGSYKNLSFLITLYVFTPQYGTIKKCNLLAILKDYTIENQGESDASPVELSVMFSVVGENPEEERATDLSSLKKYTPPQKSGQTGRTGTSLLDNLSSLVNIF